MPRIKGSCPASRLHYPPGGPGLPAVATCCHLSPVGAAAYAALVEGRPTIYDVAREAGVAPSTVSRAYARPGRVNARTARLIFEVAERIGYRSERVEARPPSASGRTQAIGLVISDVTNPFYGPIISGAYEAAREAGFLLILSHTTESPAAERRAVETELSRVDGLVIASSRMSDSALRTIAKQKALVLLNRTIPEVHCVVTDNPRGVRRAAEHLGMLGHEGILYVAGPEASWSDGVRWRALREAGMELELDVRRIGPHEPTILAGFRAARRVVSAGATAVLAYNDQLAIGVMKGVRHLGLRVPDDVSVVGFDNIIFDEIVEPALTTVAAPLLQMGTTGVHNCIAVTHGARPSTPALVLPVKLVERASTAHRKRYSTSPARGTTSVSGSAANAATSMEAGSA
jgi:DNA-binding LacI/PurR family transcriptional regulator